MSELLDLPELIARARAEFDISQERIVFGAHVIEYYRPTDPESILDEETLLSAHGELDWQPYWAQAWDAGLGMCQYMIDQPIQGKRILDLGCGIGLTSALMLAAGGDVVCGDNAPPSLLFAKINTWPWKERAKVQLVDWHTTQLDQTFGIIIGSDIVYERCEVNPLDQFFRAHLAVAGNVILSDPSRPMTREFLQMFRELGWQLQESSITVDDVKQPIRIVRMTLA